MKTINGQFRLHAHRQFTLLSACLMDTRQYFWLKWCCIFISSVLFLNTTKKSQNCYLLQYVPSLSETRILTTLYILTKNFLFIFWLNLLTFQYFWSWMSVKFLVIFFLLKSVFTKTNSSRLVWCLHSVNSLAIDSSTGKIPGKHLPPIGVTITIAGYWATTHKSFLRAVAC